MPVDVLKTTNFSILLAYTVSSSYSGYMQLRQLYAAQITFCLFIDCIVVKTPRSIYGEAVTATKGSSTGEDF